MKLSKRLCAFVIASALMAGYIVIDDMRADNRQSYAFAETLPNISNGDAPFHGPVLSVEYDIEHVDVAYDTQTVYNENKPEGYKSIIQEGSNGIKQYVYAKLKLNGGFVSRRVVEENITKEPVSEIVEIGTKKLTQQPSRSGMRYKQELSMVATAYDLSYESTGKYPGDPLHGITASGTKAKLGTVAVDPRVIPLGTRLYIASTDGTPDYGFAVAEDTGGAIKGNKIDLFMESATDVYNFGIRNVVVYVLE